MLIIDIVSAHFFNDSQQPQMTHSTQDNAEGGDEGEEDDEWKHFVESATPQDAPNLQTFLGAKSIRETAKENFSTGLEECIAGLNEAMINEMLQDSVVAVHQEQGERFEAYEADIIATMKSNHTRRKALLSAWTMPTSGGTGSTNAFVEAFC